MHPLYPRAHLLGIPQETRDVIYSEIVKIIQSERHRFEGNPVSSYDGLRLSCRQLHEETSTSVFCFKYTSRQIDKLLELKPIKTNFMSVRSLSIEIPLNLDSKTSNSIINFLQHFQLSIQEFRVFFTGNDRQNNRTYIHGCGKKEQVVPFNGMTVLRYEGQDFEQQWQLIRQIALLRNLRVLQIENANLPLSAGLLCNNKPYLKALSVTSDPRSVASSLCRKNASEVMQLYSNVGIRVNTFPQIKVLSLSANSASDAEGIVAGVSPTLEHFSWRVPNPSLQERPEDRGFCSMTNRVVQNLRWRARRLDTLRLCINTRAHNEWDDVNREDFYVLTDELSLRLHLFTTLRHLEIHFRGAQGPGGFFRTDLIARLPPGLLRLYLSDSMISVTDLVTQVRMRYFTYLEDARETSELAARAPSPYQNLSRNEYQEIESDYLGEDESLGKSLSCGELRDRLDDIPLTGGNLGFVDFEYSCMEADDEFPILGYHRESDRTKLLRLNGRLLDREHNLYLADTELTGGKYGIKPRLEYSDFWSGDHELTETSTYSVHDGIRVVISDNVEKPPSAERAPHEKWVREHMQELEESFEDIKKHLKGCSKSTKQDSEIDSEQTDNLSKEGSKQLRKNSKKGCCEGPWDWYFGNEKEAEKVFRSEVAAKPEGQKQKPGVMEVDVCESERCRWACPDYDVPPVGCFTTPKVPADWRDQV